MVRSRCSVLATSAILVVLLANAVVVGDVVVTHDGRTFEGRIISSDDSKVRIDAMVNGVRVQLGLSRMEVKSVEERPLPEDFFEKTPVASERVSDPREFEPDATLYLEVPIVGRFGVQVVAAGVEKCLAYAARHKIPHVVFHVDSHGGDQVTAKDIYDLLGKYDERLQYHAIVRDSVGVAMAVTVWCDNLFILPGANLGGAVITPRDDVEGDPGVYIAQVAHVVDMTAEAHGWPAGVVRAMIDPEALVAAWTGASGEIMTGARAPADVPAEAVIVRDDARSVLTMTREQAVALGVGRSFDGSAEDLGLSLEALPWRKESDYGRNTMAAAAATQQRRLAREQARHDAKIGRLVKRRDETKRYTERYMTLAHKWDPEQQTYSTYREHSNSWERYWAGEPIASTITRQKWQSETDTTVAYLKAAHKGVRELKRLEEQAAELDVAPLFKEGELDALQDDIEVKIEYLLVQRNRRTSAT